jgi:hypothetical protein
MTLACAAVLKAMKAAMQPSSSVPSQPATSTTAKRPSVTPTMVASFLQAMLTSAKVSPEVEAARLAICEKCDRYVKPDDGSPAFCGMCGCKVSTEGWRIMNLAAYVENLPQWGCKNPLRGWTKPDGAKVGWALLVTTNTK